MKILSMDDRTMLEIVRINNSFAIWYLNQDKRSPIFFADCNELLHLRDQPRVITQNMYSFITFVKKNSSDVINLGFTWLSEEGNRLVGWRDWVSLPYSKLMAFIEASVQKGGPTKGQFLSVIPDKEKHPHIVFCDTDRLRECLSRKDVRRKLIRFLRDRFQWEGSEEIRLYNDPLPYSFTFQEIRSGNTGVTGRLILHNHEDMDAAHYSIHMPHNERGI